MKNLVVIGLLTAIGSVLVSGLAHAESAHCRANPGDSRCQDYPDFEPRAQPPRASQPVRPRPDRDPRSGPSYNSDDGGGYDGGGYDAPPHRQVWPDRHLPTQDDMGDGQPRRPHSDWENRDRPRWMPPRPPADVFRPDRRRDYCEVIADELRDYGYRRVRAVDCEGRNFKYVGERRDGRYLIKIDVRSGRILYESRQ